MSVLSGILLLAATVTAREYTDEDIASFPKLFHLDDYDRCLARKDGLYCLGTFDLTPDVLPNPSYELIKAYSDESYRHYNRTLVQRGYCVSSRCHNAAVSNASQRFEHCVNEAVRVRGLRASINTLHYCQTHADKHAERPSTSAQQIFLQCIYAILAINIIGTIYYAYGGDGSNKNKLMTAFSIPENWRKLTVIREGADPRLLALSPLDGIRVMALIASTYAHNYVNHIGANILNPEYFEEVTQRIDGTVLSDGTTLMQALITMSCFLTSYSLLVFSQKRPLNLLMLPMCIIKRVVRVAPVSFLLTGYAATWWPYIRGGPLMSSTIGAESRACRSKFWYHAFFVHHVVDTSEYCIGTSWFLGVDMHLYIVACAFTLVMWRHRSAALKLYPALLLASCLLNGVVAYIKEYKSMFFMATPEEVRALFQHSPSFVEFYISSWGALPACFIGLILAHVLFELDDKRINLSEYKWFVYLHYWTFPFLIFRGLTGLFSRSHRASPMFHAIYIALERPSHCIIMCIAILGLVHVDGPLRRFLSWSGFTKMSRLSLTVMLLHWCVNKTITTRPYVFSSSFFDLVVDWGATYFISYVLAVPITVFLEIPMQAFFRQILS